MSKTESRAIKRVTENPTNVWAWYELAKSVNAQRIDDLTDIASDLGILNETVRKAINGAWNI